MTTPPSAPPAGFAALGLDKARVEAVTALGYEEPTPIQREAIPVLLSGRDLVGQAGTGTGKTAAFALPMLARIAAAGPVKRGPAGLVLVPTRELAMQVAEAVHKYSRGLNLSVVPLYGGAPMDQQIRALRRGAAVVVATPGRALDHLRRQTMTLEAVTVLVLDEADEMLDMGFAEELEAILAATPKVRQTALFAATMAPRIAAIAERHLSSPSRVTIAREKRAPGKLPQVRQTAYIVSRAQKHAALDRVLEFENPKAALVFCRTRLEVDELTDILKSHGYSAYALHGGMEQNQRDRVMQLFRREQADILVATDVAARGLDIEHISHVINYDVPSSPEVYVHRIGRTGRIGREGVAITLVDPREQRIMRSIEALTKQRIEIASVPSEADLRARRLETIRATLQARLAQGGLDAARPIVEALARDHDMLDIAAAAIALAQEAADGAVPARPDAAKATPEPESRSWAPAASRRLNETRRPDDARRSDDRRRPDDTRRADDTRKPYERRGAGEGRGPAAPRPPAKVLRGHEGRHRSDEGPSRKTGRAAQHDPDEPFAVLYIGAGKKAGIRPGDLVGAITGETDVVSGSLGSIRVADDHSLIQVPESLATHITQALRATTLRGKKVEVRRHKPRSD